MSVLTWVLIALAIWHFTVFVPDRFAGGIVGGFAASAFGGALGGFLLSGLTIPSRADTTTTTVLLGIPGCLIALVALYAYGAARENKAGQRVR